MNFSALFFEMALLRSPRRLKEEGNILIALYFSRRLMVLSVQQRHEAGIHTGRCTTRNTNLSDGSEGPNPAPLGPVHCGDLRPAGCGCVVLHMGWRSLPSELSCVTCPQLQPKSVCGHKYRKSISNSYRKILNFCVRKTFFN